MNGRAVLFTSVLWATLASPLQAQCPGCAMNFTCSVDPAYPTLCPTQPPDATAGQAYGSDITFYLPHNFTDTETGLNVDFLLMTITGVSGLPYGLNITYSAPLGVYHPQEDEHGCARICGTPISAGSYTITISIIAQVDYNGFTLNVPKQFPLTLLVQPGIGGNASFSYTPTTGCGSVEVQFNALIDGQGSPVTYAWDFGNGSTGSDASMVQTYGAPGTYSISLQTIIGGYVLNNVNVGGVNDNWCGDVEEISLFGSCQGAPDIYFVLTDGQGGTYGSSHGDNSTSESWSDLNIPLGTPPYSIEFWDEDLISPDDALGTYNIPLGGAGDYAFNVAGGTFGMLHVDLVPQQIFNDTDTVAVFEAPQPVLNYDTTGLLCLDELDFADITWFNDGDTVITGSFTCIPADSSGTWWALVTNGSGCTTSSDTIVICPEISIQQSGAVLYTETGLDNYQWSLNGQPLPGEDGPFLISATGGDYSVSATNIDGCVLTAAYALVVTGTGGMLPTAGLIDVFPVPSDGRMTVRVSRPCSLTLFDATGRPIRMMPLEAGSTSLSWCELAAGSYYAKASSAYGVGLVRISIVH